MNYANYRNLKMISSIAFKVFTCVFFLALFNGANAKPNETCECTSVVDNFCRTILEENRRLQVCKPSIDVSP